MDFDAAADELYGLSPTEFTRARDARVAEARQEGDRETAAALKGLRRPSVGAWLANRLVRQRPDEVDRVLALGAELREAQAQLDGASIRRFSSEGREAVAALVNRASALGRDDRHGVSENALHDLETTLDAALADAEAAAALRGGRLTNALHYSGLGLAEAMVRPPPGGRRTSDGRTAQTAAVREVARATRDLEQARSQLRDAETALRAAERTLAERHEVAQDAARRVREAEQAVRDAETRAPSRRGSGR